MADALSACRAEMLAICPAQCAPAGLPDLGQHGSNPRGRRSFPSRNVTNRKGLRALALQFGELSRGANSDLKGKRTFEIGDPPSEPSFPSCPAFFFFSFLAMQGKPHSTRGTWEP